MRLDLLLKREDFAKTFEISFARYLFEVFNISATVNWRNNTKDSNFLLVNPKLNVIYSKNIDRAKLKLIVSEYEYNPNLVRRFLQKIYIKLSISTYFEHLFAKTIVSVSPWIESFDEVCIVPGNQSIRIINLETLTARVILKEGFSSQSIRNEIYLRQKYKFLPIPKLLNVDTQSLWFEELQVSALPFNRIDNQTIKDKILIDVKRNLLKLYSETTIKIDIKNYVKSLYETCDNFITKLPEIYTKFDKKEIRDIFILLNETVKNFPDRTIDLVQSHGDLQLGNILVGDNNSELYLIDWEYTEKRSIFYDSLVLATDCRKPKGLAKRIKTILDGADLSWNWCIKTDGFRLSKCELAIFLIEDLIVRLSELNIPNLIIKDNGLDLWLKEVKKMDWLIHKKA
tara:strand:+ start:516 stop:1712 length:1197 start_codon:yes stop_codon:yes gene_type:complete